MCSWVGSGEKVYVTAHLQVLTSRYEKMLKAATHTCPAAHCHPRIPEALDRDSPPAVPRFQASNRGWGAQSMSPRPLPANNEIDGCFNPNRAFCLK